MTIDPRDPFVLFHVFRIATYGIPEVARREPASGHMNGKSDDQLITQGHRLWSASPQKWLVWNVRFALLGQDVRKHGSFVTNCVTNYS